MKQNELIFCFMPPTPNSSTLQQDLLAYLMLGQRNMSHT